MNGKLSAGLLLVLIAAKVAMIWGHAAPFTTWSVLAYLWQDMLVALAFAGVSSILQKPAALYWAVAIYAAINIPVARVLSTPLTQPMLRAARGPLADSLLVYMTAVNIVLVMSLLTLAALLPLLLRPIPPRWIQLGAVCLIPLALLGPTASRRADVRGMDRNALTALIAPGVPTTSAHAEATNFRQSRFETPRAEDLSAFAGTAHGFNIVMVSLESTAAQYLSLYGSGYDVMPNLSRLARSGLVFENAYAVYPESIKGLYSVLCSAFPAFDSRPQTYEKVPCRSVAEVLADTGYRTAMFHSGRFAYLGMESIIRNRGYQLLADAGDIGGNHNSSFGVDEPATVAKMLTWIDELPRRRPFFLTYLPIAGHHPYATPERGPFPGTAELDQYRNALHYGDESLGALIQGLRERGLEDNTVWVIYGDHGEAFGQHPGNYGHAFFLYDENVHVPFLIAAPSLMRTQQRVHKVVSLVDTAPTLLHFLGISPPPNYQGQSMLDGTSRMALFFADYSLGLLGLRDGPWKFQYEIGRDRGKLYHLERDPRETLDLSGDASGIETARATWYRQVVKDWCREQKTDVERSLTTARAPGRSLLPW